MVQQLSHLLMRKAKVQFKNIFSAFFIVVKKEKLSNFFRK